VEVRSSGRGRHWALAAIAAAGLHLAVAAWVFRSIPPPGASFGGGGSVQVALAPSSGPSAAEALTRPRQDATEVVPDATVAPSAPVIKTPAAPSPEAIEAPVAERDPDAVVPPDAVAEPAVAEVVQAVTPEAVPVLEVSTIPVPEIEVVEARDAVVPPTPQPSPPAPKPAVARPLPAKPAPSEAVRASEAPPLGGAVSASSDTQGRPGSQTAGGQPSPEANYGAPAREATAPGGSADYMSRLRAWLEQHKEYPHRARQRRIQGTALLVTALLVFVMDRGGNILSHRIERSSGDRTLDHAVEDMIERAQPLPRMPDSFQQAQLEIRVPVQFLLR